MDLRDAHNHLALYRRQQARSRVRLDLHRSRAHTFRLRTTVHYTMRRSKTTGQDQQRTSKQASSMSISMVVSLGLVER